jgi:hypothetical protein
MNNSTPNLNLRRAILVTMRYRKKQRGKAAKANGKVRRKRCYLLELPAELRLQIYEYVFEDIKPRCAPLKGGEYFEFPRGWPVSNSTTALLRTCRQVLAEARPVLYSQVRTFQVVIDGLSSRSKDLVWPEHKEETKSIVPLMRTIELKFSTASARYACGHLKEMVELFSQRGLKVNFTRISFFQQYAELKPDPTKTLTLFVLEMDYLANHAQDGTLAKEMYDEVLQYLRRMLQIAMVEDQQHPSGVYLGDPACFDNDKVWDKFGH